MKGQSFRVSLVLVMLLQTLVASSQPGARPAPPREPAVRPIVSAPVEVDQDRSRVDDRIEQSVAGAQATLARTNVPTSETAAAQAALDELIDVELIFESQVTQAQIDAFIAAGGEFSHLFTHVSYGWTGRIARKHAVRLPSLMGKSLLGVIGKTKAVLHLDEAGRTGRVRPDVWNLGIDGRSTGEDRITIAILDTGVDGTHNDLSGRNVYWRDWTADNHTTSQDRGHHGSHVAGIAFGSGVSSGVSPSTISFMDLGNMPSTSGSFYPSPIHIPTSVTTATLDSTMIWETGMGRQARLGHVNRNSGGGYVLVNGSYASGSGSPLLRSDTAANPYPDGTGTNTFSAYPSKNSGGGTPEYAVTNTASYAGVGDGYNLVRGVAPDSSWAGFKVFEDNGAGTSIDIDEALDDLVAQASTHRIKVANMSLGYSVVVTSTRNKTNTAALNGVVVCVSAGNSGDVSSGAAGEVTDPGRAHYCITVASSSDINQLTDYSSHGFSAPGDANSGDEDTKPDIMAPGGSTGFQSNIMSVDSNTGDSWDTTGANYADQVANNYLNIQGTSMASPYIAGCVALVIDALQATGETWDFTGGAALADVLRVKALLLMTATETNQNREAGPSGNPTLSRGAKDINEGYGIVNPDAAVESLTNSAFSGPTVTASGLFGGGRFDKRCWARRVLLNSGTTASLTLTVPAVGDYDLYLYSATPNTYGNPVILASSVSASTGTTETINYSAPSSETAYVVVKRVTGGGFSGSDFWYLNGTLGADLVAPTVAAVSAVSERTIHLTFSEAMSTGVTTVANYAASGPGVGTLTANPDSASLVAGSTYLLTWNSPREMLNGSTVTVTVTGVTDASNNPIGSPNSGSTLGIGTAPGVSLNSAAGDPTNTSPIPVTVTLTESSSNFVQGDIAASNGTVQNFAGSGTNYSFDLVPSGQGAVSASVAAGAFTDAAGNPSVTSASLSRVYDTVAPTISLSTTATDPTNVSPIPVTVLLSESSGNFAPGDIATTNATVQNFAGSGANYSFNLVPSGQGVVSAAVAAGMFTDGAANLNTASNVLSRAYDSVAPTIALSTTASDPTSTAPIPVTVLLSESSVNFAQGDIATTNATVQNFTGAGVNYSFDLMPSGQGGVGASVPAGAFTDTPGNSNSASNALTRTYDSVAPTVALSTTASNPTNSSPISVTVLLSEASTNFVQGDISTTNGVVQNFAGSGVNYSFDLLPSGQGVVGAFVAGAAFTDAASNGNTASNSLTRTYDTVAPTIALSTTAPDPTNASPVLVTVLLSESSVNFAQGDIVTTNASVQNFAGSGSNYTFDLVPSGQGAVSASVGVDSFTDSATNGNAASNVLSRTYDSIAPTVSLNSAVAALTNQSPIPVTVTLSESSADFAQDDITTANVTVQAFAGSGTSYTLDLVPVADGPVTASVSAGRFSDSAGNLNSQVGELTRVFDGTSPAVGSVSALNGTTVDLTFDEANSMAADALNAALYAVSGPGTGSVAANPDSVTHLVGNTFRLSWSAGAMVPGQSITITVQDGVSGVHDAAGNPMSASVSASTTALPVGVSDFRLD